MNGRGAMSLRTAVRRWLRGVERDLIGAAGPAAVAERVRFPRFHAGLPAS
jgi:hypothetical protein